MVQQRPGPRKAYATTTSLGALGVLVAALRTLGGVDAARAIEHLLVLVLFRGRAVQAFLEYGLRLDGLELGLEVLEARRVAAAVGAATGVCQVKALVLDFLALDAPSTLPSTILLGLLGVGVGVARLGEVTREVFGGLGSAVCEAGVIAIIVLVRFAHDCEMRGSWSG